MPREPRTPGEPRPGFMYRGHPNPTGNPVTQRTDPEDVSAPPWHALEPGEVLGRLDVAAAGGLDPAEAGRRLAEQGPNELTEADRVTPLQILARQFKDVLILILVVAAAVSLVIGDVVDALAIVAILVLNAILGFAQEWRAERALAALASMLAPQATVLRGGHPQRVEAATVVPGDVVLLEAGDRVPADLRILEARSLEVDEAALTGESVAVAKTEEPVEPDAPLATRRSMAWMGTTVAHGRGRGVVVATGMATEFGRIATLTQAVGREATPLQRKLGVLGRQLGILSLALAALVAVLGYLAGNPLVTMFLTGVSLAVAVVPEGLPAVVTLTLALGVRAMAKRRALLRRLQAAEALGSATVICTDKTGTLTRNEMTLRVAWVGGREVEVTGTGYAPEGSFRLAGEPLDIADAPELRGLLRTGALCNRARLEPQDDGTWSVWGSGTEAALLVAARKAGLDDEGGDDLVEFPFDARRKRMTVLEPGGDGAVAHVKGAPEAILVRCTRVQAEGGEERLEGPRLVEAQAAFRDLASRGLRTLAIARRRLPPGTPAEADAVEQDLTLLGIVGILDPPRPEVPDAVAAARRAGVRVIMVTGDAPGTARAVAAEVGLPAETVLEGNDLDAMDDDALAAALAGDAILARTTPEQKLRIVTLLEDAGEVVAMTGDGVNDAPALKRASVGVAMGIRGTDVAREAADIVLTDDNFASIVSAVEEGRRQVDNVQKFVRYLLSSNVGEVVAILAAVLLGWPLILLPVQILWINLVTDGVAAVALGLEPVEPDAMDRPPRDPRARILDRTGFAVIGLLGAAVGAVTLLLFSGGWTLTAPDLGALRTLAFTGLVAAELVNVFNFRSLRQPLVRVGVLSNPVLLLAWVGTALLQVGAVYLPVLQEALGTVALPPTTLAMTLLVSVPIFVVPELVKWARSRRSVEG